MHLRIANEDAFKPNRVTFQRSDADPTIFLLVNNETAISVANPNGIEIMPGFCNGMGASEGGSP
jgi:hypothetical protein